MRLRRVFITAALVAVLALPAAAHAQLIKTPNCERTIYVAQQIGVENPQKREFTPDQWDALEDADRQFWEVRQVKATRTCGFDDFLQLFANLAAWGFTVLAGTALLFFIWGGFTLLISAGREEKVQEGKRILQGTFIGVLVVLTAWIFVNFFYVAFTGNSQGFIFPKSPFKREGLIGDSGCRYAFHQRYPTVQPSCTATNLQYGCADPVASNGPVVRLQTLLNQQCGGVSVDGCFGDNTAIALFQFMIANGIPVSSEDFRSVKTNSALIDFLEDPNAHSCTKLLIDPTIDPPPVGDGTLEGCCVPSKPGYPCYNQDDVAICLVDDPGGDLDIRAGYRWIQGSCDTVLTCQTGCCMRFKPDGKRDCSSTCGPTNCTAPGTIWVAGQCDFISGLCVPASICSP